MIISYKLAIPDQGVETLRSDLESLIGELDSNLTGKINGLDVRVSALEQTGTIAISDAIVDNDRRTVAINVLTTDHTLGTNVTFNVNDSESNTVSAVEVLEVDTTTRQKAETIIDVSTLVAGTLNVVVSSQDNFGKARNDTVVRSYSPTPSAITLAPIVIDPRRRIAPLSATMDLGYEDDELLTLSNARLTVVNSVDANDIIVDSLIAYSKVHNQPILVWDQFVLDTTASRLDFIIDAVDAYGDPVQGAVRNVDSEELAEPGIYIQTARYDGDTTYTADVTAFVWGEATTEDVSLTLSNAGGSVTPLNGVRSTSFTPPPESNLDFAGAARWKWNNVDISTLSAATVTAEVTVTDDYGRTGSDNRAMQYVPIGTIEAVSNTANSASKTLAISFETQYISIGQEVTVTLSSPVNGLLKVYKYNMTDVDFTFPNIDLTPFPFGRINQQATVEDQTGNIAVWDSFTQFDDVQGDVTPSTETTLNSYTDIADVRWIETGVVEMDLISITDRNGVSRELTDITRVPDGELDANKWYSELISVAGLAYGSLTIRFEGRDGSDKLLIDEQYRTYTDEEGILELDNITFNPTTRKSIVAFSYDNLKAGETVSIVHWSTNEPELSTTDVLFTVPDVEAGSMTGEFTYPYPDSEDLGIRLVSEDAKGDAIQTDDETVNNGEDGEIILNLEVDDVTGKLTASGTVNDSVTRGTNIIIAISGQASLNASATVTSSLTFSKEVQLPVGNYGEYIVKVTVRDDYAKNVTDTETIEYESVNGSISINTATTTVRGSTLRLEGSQTNIAEGATTTINVYEYGSTVSRLTKTFAMTPADDWAYNISMGGTINTPPVPYGAVVIRATVTDLGGTVRTTTKNATYLAVQGSAIISVTAKDINNGVLTAKLDIKDCKPETTVKYGYNVNGTEKVFTAPNTGSTGTRVTTVNMDISAYVGGTSTPDVDIWVSTFDHNGEEVNGELNNVAWDNSAEVEVTSVSIASGQKNATIEGTITNVPVGHPVTFKARNVHTGAIKTVSLTTKLISSGNDKVKFEGSMDMSSLANGSYRLDAIINDLQGNEKYSGSVTTWNGHGAIEPQTSVMTYGVSGTHNGKTRTADITFSADVSGDFKSGSQFLIRVYEYQNSTTINAIRQTDYYVTASNRKITATAKLTTDNAHGNQFIARFSNIDGAGDSIVENTTDRQAMTYAEKASFAKDITYIGRDSSTGYAIFEYGIAKYLSYGNGWRSPATKVKSPGSSSAVSVNESLNRWSGTTAYFRFLVNDLTTVGDYFLSADWLTAQSQTGKSFSIADQYTHVKEEDAELDMSYFLIQVQTSNRYNTVTGFKARGTLEAGAPSGRTVYCEFSTEVNAATATWTDITDSLGKWEINTSGTDGVYTTEGDIVFAKARCTYNGKLIYSETRRDNWPSRGGGDRNEF